MKIHEHDAAAVCRCEFPDDTESDLIGKQVTVTRRDRTLSKSGTLATVTPRGYHVRIETGVIFGFMRRYWDLNPAVSTSTEEP